MPLVKTYLTEPDLEKFGKWLYERLEAKGISPYALGERIGRHGAHDIEEMFAGKPIMPKTLRRICAEIEEPWPRIFLDYGLYEELFFMLDDLVWIGQKWCEEDNAYPWADPATRFEFRSIGVCRIGNKPVWEAFKDPRIRDRYHVGTYEQDNPRPDEVPPELEHFYTSPIRLTNSIVPKPMAVALLIATGGFCRRGDYYRDGTNILAAEVLDASVPLIDYAEQRKRRECGKRKPSDLPDLLQGADATFDDKLLNAAQKRTIAAEYVNSWADTVSAGYTYYARLVTFAYWGEVGSSESTASPWAIMPQVQRPRKLDVNELRVNALE